MSKSLKTLENRLKTAPAGSVRISVSHGVPQYYIIEEKSQKNGRYVPKSEIELVKKLVQKSYDLKVATAMKKDLRQVESFLKKVNLDYGQFYEKLPAVAKELVKPEFVSVERFAQDWCKVHYDGKKFEEGAPEFYTAAGVRVRSKSEIIIADALSRFGVPYRYEFPVELKNAVGNFVKLYPDFCCLNVSTGEEFLWEHFGRMDDGDYAAKTARKLDLYQRNDIFPGEKLLMTMETSEFPLNSKNVERIIRKYLM
ncbi:MAG: hypothetical protein KBT11_06340 [Treponema sp.]|nr:hypothetical protein [Candidatus Treponema equifaecale]